MNVSRKKRITMRLKHPNPLFEQWLTEWRDKAIETDSKMQHCFGKALQSLRKYPLPLESGRDCRILQGFGEKLCLMLDRKLAENKQQSPDGVSTGNKSPCNAKGKTKGAKSSEQSLNLNTSTKQKEYIPAWRSGPYAILVTLYEKSLQPQHPGYMLKTDIIKFGQHLCDKSFLKPDPGSYYTAWSSMKTLLDKNLVIKKSSPAQFTLTNEGLVLAHKLFKNNLNDNIDKINNVACATVITAEETERNDLVLQNRSPEKPLSQKTNSSSSSSLSLAPTETFILTPHSFKIILLIDKQETSGASSRRDVLDDPILAEVSHLNVSYETRHLKVGDYAWVCRQNSTNIELVLPYIVERKRMDDFGSSIKDGRFHEQKFRLKQCGIQNLIYLIESHGKNTHTGLPLTTLYQAATNTLLQDNFSVKFTDNLRGTAEYLASFTSLLDNMYQSKTLMSCPKQNLEKCTTEDDLIPLMTFEEFNKGASKNRNFKVRELFVKQLVQLNGMSVEKALAIVDVYQTPQLLQQAYKTHLNKEKMLSAVQYGKLSKKIGPVISKVISQFYCDKF